MSQPAWDKVAEQEAQALATMLSSDARAVMVIVIGVDSDAHGTCHMCHAVGGQTTGATLRSFIFAVERKLKWLRDKLYKRA